MIDISYDSPVLAFRHVLEQSGIRFVFHIERLSTRVGRDVNLVYVLLRKLWVSVCWGQFLSRAKDCIGLFFIEKDFHFLQLVIVLVIFSLLGPSDGLNFFHFLLSLFILFLNCRHDDRHCILSCVVIHVSSFNKWALNLRLDHLLAESCQTLLL